MADYNLYGLNTRDFQHLVQSIARKRIGAGVTAFGDGRDGARDLTFRGKMDYPSTAAGWDGYLVMGCKFSQRPSGDSQKDTDWALKQLDGDLKKFVSKKRKLPKPQYYILATNVALSGVAASGGRDRVTRALEEYSGKLGLKSYAIWDYNDIRGFLDGDTDIREAYGHFITSGDVLAQIAEWVKPKMPDFIGVMHSFLQKELVADMSAKLQSAGEDPELQIPLACVFVDLPFASSAEAAVLASEEEEEELPRVVDALLEAGSRILRKIADDDESAARTTRASNRKFSRFVIVGGPGQGKSTFGQYLCQLYRASILRDRPKQLLDDKVPLILKQLDRERSHVGGLPAVRRFPLRIELRDFAHALASEPQLTLLEYIRSDISRLGGGTLSLEDLKSWLVQYPWLLVLDGLDEVPPSSNRGEVLKEIESFRIDAASANADMLVVSTTRPQSYSNEFSEDLFRHLYLTPLSPTQALEYGRKVAEARCGADERRKEELFRSLEKACQSSATSRLMQSPLQVTIMATLLEDTGEPPQQRYRLFAEYYRTIYKRETRRKLLGGILTERQKDIDTIHAQAGLLVHSAGEKTTPHSGRPRLEDVDSALSDAQFRELVRRRLEQIGIIEPRASELLARISNSALDRLVFLVRQRVGWVRFDITSFKEFMAAEAIMNGSDEDIRRRLEVIGPASYWRNVFQFAVGKCFLEREHLLDNLVSLCTGLNEELASRHIFADETAGRAANGVLWGSRLALDVLADGTARQYPGYEVRFTRIALQLTRLPDAESCARLAAVFHEDLKDLFFEAVEDRLGQSSFWAQLGGWQLLTSLADREIPWALQTLEARWPAESEAQRVILFGRRRRAPSKWFINKLIEVAPKIEPRWFFRYLRPDLAQSHIPVERGPWQHILRFLESGGGQCQVAVRSAWSDVLPRVFFTPLHLGNELSQSLERLEFSNSEWFPLVAGARFGANPTAKTLSSELTWLADKWLPSDSAWIHPLPWPLGACLSRAKSRDDLVRFADAAQRGFLGDTKHWTTAEQRWRQTGLLDDDFLTNVNETLPISPELSAKGFPFGVFGWSTNDTYSAGQLAASIERLRQIQNSEASSWIASLILSLWEYPRGRRSMPSPSQIKELCGIAARRPHIRWRAYWLENVISPTMGSPLSAEWIDFFDWLGREGSMISIDIPRQDIAGQLIQHFSADPEGRRGLLSIIAELARAGCHCPLPWHALSLAMTWDTNSRDDAFALSLARPDVNDGEITAAARELLRSNSKERAVFRALRIASVPSLKQAAKLALAFLTQLQDLSEAESDAADHARRTLSEFLTNLPSLLQDPQVWKKLNLPERL